jgi:hypothetical protein
VSFANVTFFGVGAYGVSLPLYSVGTNWSALVIEFIAGGAGSGDRPLLAPGAADFLRHATPAIAYALQRVRFAALGVTVARTAAKVPEALQLVDRT